ncbi:Protein ZGRF1 [Madurella mycetomatis]|uniref:Protein ZGRF1 n=1 Tax=Madurella mycetomatis TaxID=100816 RepID=A0A175W1I1_9PEZI|nr:Protein ZGRF1 [Madurella mycetomatis]
MPSTAIPGTAVHGASGPSSGGHNAPVLEFLCLFTHDLRRKQKRWQDGRLKYHTFNKRVMVYDDRGNFVGDMHWRREWEFDEGEEVELERGGIIVQVAECVGRQNQDLSELLDKRVKEREQRQARVATRALFSAPSARTPLPAPVAQDHFQTRHRPLHQLLGTPTGHHGRASVPTESPFELRQKANETSGDHPDSRPVKRRKYDATPPSKMGYAQSLFGAPLTLSAVPVSSAPPRRPTVPASRTASETPTHLEEAIPSAKRRSEDTGLCAQRGQLRTSADGATEGSSTDPLSDTDKSRSPRQTRKIHNKDRGVSARSTEDVYTEESADDSEELPQVPVGPRLVRLGKTSVRSMEVIGFVPSSSPVVDMVKAGKPRLGPPSDTGPPNADNDAMVHADSPVENLPVTGEGLAPSHVVQHLARANIVSPPLEASTRAAGPALQRHISLLDNGTRDTAIIDSREGGGETSRIQHLGDPPSHQGLVRHRSAVSSPESGIEKDTPPQVSVPSLPNTARPKKDIMGTVRPCGTGGIQTAESTVLQSQSHEPSNLPKRAGHPMNVKNDTAGAQSLGAGGTSPLLLNIPSAGTAGRPRIQNPATRGRKAALKSDAAGQVPQSILPTEPILARPGVRPPAMMRLEPVVVNERPKRTMRFPGFVSARGGGPWSREAHDLLESGRPG